MFDSDPPKGMEFVNQFFEGFDKVTPWVVFTINHREYGVEALKVKEVIRYAKPMRLPRAPQFIEGLVNFRGEMIPLIDLRKVFHLETGRLDQPTAIVVIETSERVFGLSTDQIVDCENLPESSIRESCGPDAKADYIKAVSQIGEGIIYLLDCDRILAISQ